MAALGLFPIKVIFSSSLFFVSNALIKYIIAFITFIRFREIIGGVEISLNEIDIGVPAKKAIDGSQGN
jgi:hypothetical protein